jgi:cytosine/adenosine deaminase-related metal-dependent hydrolase
VTGVCPFVSPAKVWEFAMTFILADAWLITMNERREVLEGASVFVEQDRIGAVGTREALKQRYPEAELVDCKGRIVMPGMVNTHTHLFQTLLKGLGDDMVLKKWFTCMTGPSAVHLTADRWRSRRGFGSANRLHRNRKKGRFDCHRL